MLWHVPTLTIAPSTLCLPQSQTTVNRIQDLFAQVGQEFPNLDPTIFTNNLNNTLEELLAGTTDSLGALSAFSPYQDTMQVASQVPDALSGVMDTLQGASSQLSDMVAAQTVTRSAAADGSDGAQAPLPAGPSPADQELLSTLQQVRHEALMSCCSAASCSGAACLHTQQDAPGCLAFCGWALLGRSHRQHNAVCMLALLLLGGATCLCL